MQAHRLQCIEVMRHNALLKRLGPEATEVLAAILEPDDYEDGELVWRAGDTADAVIVVASGALTATGGSSPGDGARLEIGAMAGEVEMFGARIRRETVTAAAPARVLSISYERFREFLLRFPEVALGLLETFARRLG